MIKTEIICFRIINFVIQYNVNYSSVAFSLSRSFSFYEMHGICRLCTKKEMLGYDKYGGIEPYLDSIHIHTI